jgi:hypothetical protein
MARRMKLCLLCKKRPVSKGPCCAHCLLEKHLVGLGLEFYVEYRFHPARMWRSDYRITNRLRNGQEVLIEIDGGIWLGKGHTGGKHYQSDIDKLNAAAALGFTVFRFSTDDVIRGRARAFLAEHLGGSK